MKARSTTDFLAVLLLLFAGIGPQEASGQSFRTETGHVAYTSSVPLHDFTGTSGQLVGRIALADSTVDFYVDLATLDSGIGKRDRDMRKVLETDRFPFAEFFGKLVSPFDRATRTPQPARVRGIFSIHGISREISVDGTLVHDGSALQLDAAWELRLEDYSIEPPRLLIMKVDQVQKLEISATLHPENP